jgi:hypothetical protein
VIDRLRTEWALEEKQKAQPQKTQSYCVHDLPPMAAPIPHRAFTQNPHKRNPERIRYADSLYFIGYNGCNAEDETDAPAEMYPTP